MFRSVKDLQGYAIGATDGAIGHVADFYFDDEDWVVRYLAVDTGHWLAGRNVIISPMAIGHPDWMAKTLPVRLTKDQIERSPDVDMAQPVSRRHEAEHLGYYGYPFYWGGGGIWGMGAYPGNLTTAQEIGAEMKTHRRYEVKDAADDNHLRSCNTVLGFRIEATDGEIGHVENMLVDDHSWAIRYLVVNTSNWWGGHQVSIAPPWISRVNWTDATVSIDLTRDTIKNSPPYDPAKQFDRQQEEWVHDHYGRQGYWAAKAIRESGAA